MYRGKKQPCRNFMRGSCHYGDQCKFLHSVNINQQQQQQQQQQQSLPTSNNNPFGFGKLANQQSKAAPSGFPKQQNQFKPFENKWTRETNSSGAGVAKQSNDPPPAQPANHTCTDSNACKRIIAEDFQHERPLWKLSCYGHFKHLPCDIKGDISPEELRAAAYDDGKKGMNLLAIVERERNTVNSKLIEYENLLRNPYVILPHTSTFPGVNAHSSPATVQNNVPPPVSSFSQLGMVTNQGSNPSAVVSPSGNFGQPNPFSVTSQTPGFSNNPTFGTQGFFGNQQHMQPHGNVSTVNTLLGFGNPTAPAPSPFQSVNVATNQEHIQPRGNVPAFNNFAVTPAGSSSAASVQSPFVPFGHNAAGSLVGQTYQGNSPDGAQGDTSIWLKEKWSPGEIPEEAPPAGYCY